MKLIDLVTISDNLFPPQVPTLSASRIKTAKTCARKYYYRYILPKDKRPKEQKNVYALKGTALHKAIELFYTENKSPKTTFQIVFLETLSQWQDEGFEIVGEDISTKVLKDGKLILDTIQWNFKPLSLEYQFTLPFPNATNPIVYIEGIIDMINFSEDDLTVSIIDHKSNSKLPPIEDIAHDAQFILYYWAYYQKHHEYPAHIYWHHLKNGNLYDIPVADSYKQKLQQLEYDIRGILANTLAPAQRIAGNYPPEDEIVFFPRRQLDSECKQCSYFNLCYP